MGHNQIYSIINGYSFAVHHTYQSEILAGIKSKCISINYTKNYNLCLKSIDVAKNNKT